MLVSLSEDEADPATGEPSVRAWRILDGEVTEVPLDVTAAHRGGPGARRGPARDRRSGRRSGSRRRSWRRSSIRRPSCGPRSSAGPSRSGVVLLSRSLVAMSGGETDIRGLDPRRAAGVPGGGRRSRPRPAGGSAARCRSSSRWSSPASTSSRRRSCSSCWVVRRHATRLHDDDPVEPPLGEGRVVGDRDDRPARRPASPPRSARRARRPRGPDRSSVRRGRGPPDPSPGRRPG